jgi:hypothetical protein
MTTGCSVAKRNLLIPLVQMGLHTDEIFARLPEGTFKNPQCLAVMISHLRREGLAAPAAHRGLAAWRFSMSSMGEDLWRKLVAQSVARHQSPWDFARQALELLLNEPVLLRNLLDEIDEREAAE